MRRLKGWLGVFLIFFFGVIVGVAITGGVIHKKVIELIEGGPDKFVEVIVKRLKDDLKLDDSQQEMLQQIAIDTRIKLRAIRQRTDPEVAQTLADAEVKVRGILNPEQAAKFDKIVERGRERWKTKDASK